MTRFTPHEIADECLRDDELRICARCGAVIDTHEWHPTIARGDPVDVYLFCSEDCAESWEGRDASTADEASPERKYSG